jgi:hypothetical protein
MLTKEILDSHPLKTLKSEISKHIYKKIKGYSTMKRPELTDIMLNNKEKFGHLKAAEKKERKAKAPNKKPLTITTGDGKVTELKKKAIKLIPKKKKEPTKLIPKKKKEPTKLIPKKKKEEAVKKARSEKQIAAAKRLGELSKERSLKRSKAIRDLKGQGPKSTKQQILQGRKDSVEKQKAKAEAKAKGRKKTVKILTLAKGQGTSTKIGNVIGPDGNSYEPSIAAPLWEDRGFKRVELSKADLKKTEKLAIKYGPFGKYGLGNQLEIFLKNKF